MEDPPDDKTFHNTPIASQLTNRFLPPLKGNSYRQILHGRVFPVQNVLCIPGELRGRKQYYSPKEILLLSYGKSLPTRRTYWGAAR